MEIKRASILVRGIVQGVGYRFFALDKAKIFSLSGYVMNLSDCKSVKLEVEGSEKLIERFIEELKKGPQGSYVEDLKIEWSDSLNGFRGFSIRY